jgi:hypothetical protein
MVMVVRRAAPPVHRLAVFTPNRVDLAALGHRLQRPVDGGKPDLRSTTAHGLEQFLSAPEAGVALESV